LLTLAHQSLTDTKKGPLKSDPLVIRLGVTFVNRIES